MIMSHEQNAGQNHNIKVGNKSFDIVEHFKYLGTTLTSQYFIKEEIKSWLQKGMLIIIWCRISFSSSLLCKNINIKISSSGSTTSLIECFGLLNDFFPFMPVLDTVLPIVYFHGIQIIFNIILPPSLGSPNDLIAMGFRSYTFTILLSGILCTCPSQPNLCDLT